MNKYTLHNSKWNRIPIGLLDDVMPIIKAHLFVGSKASWDVITSGGYQYETMPNLSVLLKILNEHNHA